MGDEGKMYVSEDVIPIYRELLPLSTIITPNHFELEYVSCHQRFMPKKSENYTF